MIWSSLLKIIVGLIFIGTSSSIFSSSKLGIEDERNVILSFITKFYEEQNNKTLKLCEINEKSLKNYVTGKKEKKKDKNFSKMDETKNIDTKKF